MNKVIVYRGKRGVTGQDGVDGSGVNDIRGELINNPLLDIYYNNKEVKIASNQQSNRIGEALIEDRYGGFEWVSSDDRTNYITYNNDFSQWGDPQNKWSIINNTTSDPDGGNAATEINLDSDFNSGDLFGIETPAVSGLVSSRYYTYSIWIRVLSGTVTSLEFNTGSRFRVDANLLNQWQRVKVSVAPNISSGFLNFIPVGLTGARIALYKGQFENGSVMTDEIDTSGSTVTIPSTESSLRDNGLGYLFEGASQNLLQNTENLIETTWTVTSGVIDEYEKDDQFGQKYGNILVNNDGLSTTLLQTTASLIEGEQYTFSLFSRVEGGSVTAVAISLGDGDSVSISDITTDDIERYSVEVVAGAGSEVNITMTSTGGDGLLVMSGLQLEQGELTSYIRNGDSENLRGIDATTTDYTINRASDNWTFQFSDNIAASPADKYVFHNNLAGTEEFYAKFNDGSLLIKNGDDTVETAGLEDSLSIGATYDGATIRVYKDGLLVNSGLISNPATDTPTSLNIGADETFSNSVNGYLSRVSFWGETLTDDEMLYIGVNNDSNS